MIGIGFYGNNIYMNPIYTPQAVEPVQRISKLEGGTQTFAAKETDKVCHTCERRKYVDGSDEANVSFKTPGHIAPEQSAQMVMNHEQQHVANARREGAKENKELLSATVSLKIGVCPECGKTYVAGGTTNTTIKTTYQESNPYEQARKTIEGSFLKGMNVDLAA